MREADLDNLSGIYDALDIGLVVLRKDRGVIIWNDWMASASGISRDKAIGRALGQLFAGWSRPRLDAAVSDAFDTGASRILTHHLHPGLFPLVTRTGRPLVHDVSLRPVGQMPFAHCAIQITDITLASEREHVLRQRQNARYAALVDNAPDAIFTLDSDGLVQIVSSSAAREFGYTPEELLAQPISMLFADKEAWWALLRSVLNGYAAQRSVELVALRKDGSPSYVEVSAARWLSQSRVFVTAIVRDVNERHAAEASLRDLNETLEERVAQTLAERKLLADLVEDTDVFIQVLDLDYQILAVNNASADEFEDVFGTRPRVGDDFLSLLAHLPSEQATARSLWSRALAGESFTVVTEFGDPKRGRRHYELKFNALRNEAGEQIAAFQFVYDVSDRIERQALLARTEEALRQSQKMDAIGQLTGGIAHDFNNLLTGIIGGIDVLKRRLAAGRYEDTQRFMDAVTASANRAAALTHRLLAFARRQPLDPKTVDANALIKGMEELLRRTLGERVRLRVELGRDVWTTRTDANQLENAILNLAINARDAMPSGGDLTIGTTNAEIAQARMEQPDDVAAGEYIVVSVRDTGEGMPAEIIPKVFDPFFTTKPIGQGTGLGLSMIYGFAKQSGGHVRIESAVGRGTDVSLYLPRHEGEVVEMQSDALIPLAAGDGEAVLLVEDDSSVRLLIGEVLRDLGYACIEATDAQSAAPILESNARLDLMITDVGLPGMNGRQLAELARKRRPHLKILFVTGYAEHATGAETFLEPGMEMVTKPFALDALALKIRDMLNPRGERRS